MATVIDGHGYIVNAILTSQKCLRLIWRLQFALLVASPLGIQAGTYGAFTYESNATGVTITGYTGPGGAVAIPETIEAMPVTSIGDYAFRDCTSLTSVTIPKDVINIGDYAFNSCTSLISTIIPDSVTTFGACAFYNCTSLTSVTIPEGVTSIGRWALSGCTSLTSIAIPSSVTKIGLLAFSGCTGVTAIEVDPLNSAFSSLEGVLFDKSRTKLVQYPCRKAGATYTIPHSVSSIELLAFNGCSNLTTITVPDSVTSIGDHVFWGCIRLRSVFFKGSAPSNGNDVFYDANSATVYHLPGTTGWGPMFADRPTALWIPIVPDLPSIASDNPLRLVTSSPAPATVRVQRSTNLLDWEDWQTVSREEGPSELQDTEVGTTPYRFYRGIEE